MPQYIPILKGKAAEYGALSHMLAGRVTMQPLLEVVPPDDDEVASIEASLIRFADQVLSKWGTADLVYSDAELVGDAPLSGGQLPIEFLFDELRSRGISGAPVIPLWATRTVWAAAVAAIAAADRRGALIRIRFDDLGEVLRGASSLDDAADAIGLARDDIDLLFDLGEIDDQRLAAYAVMAEAGVRAAGPRWRSITLASGAFPENLSGLPLGRSTVSRADAQLWRRVAPVVSVELGYGDYAIAHPALGGGVPFAPPPQLRYTSTDQWVVMRGRRGDPRGNAQFYDLCAQLVATADYSGATLSWGDDYIDQAARSASTSPPVVGPGSGKTWREVGTSHHLAYVVSRLTSAGVP